MEESSKPKHTEEKVVSGGALRRRKVAPKKSRPRKETPQLATNEFEKVLGPDLYHWVAERVELVDIGENSIELKLADDFAIPSLPNGYYFKGGVAREILRRNLYPATSQLKFRDYDIVRFEHTTDEFDHSLSLRFMEDDYEFGRGVEVVENKTTYFVTRDLGVNEVLLRNNWAECSLQSLRDNFSKSLRPAPYVKNAEGKVQSRIIAKAVRIYAECLVKNIQFKLSGIPKDAKIAPFDVALHLDRALAFNDVVAKEYLSALWELDLLPDKLETPPDLMDAVKLLSPHMERGVRFFRNLPVEVLQALA